MTEHLLINFPLFYLLHILLASAVTGTWTGSRRWPITSSVQRLRMPVHSHALSWIPTWSMSCLSRRSPHGGGGAGSDQAHGAPSDLPSELLTGAFPSCSNEPELKRFKHSKAWIANPCNSAAMLVAIWMLLAWTTGQWQNWRPVLQFGLFSTPVIPSLLPSLCLSFSLHLPEYISANTAEQVQRSKQVASLH